MGTRMTSKGQVTIPQSIREAAGLRPGDVIEFAFTPNGKVSLQKQRSAERYLAKLRAVRRRKPVRGETTDEIMADLRGDR